MRRLLVIGACLVGLGWLAWLVWRRSSEGAGASGDFINPSLQTEPEVPEQRPEVETGASVEGEPWPSSVIDEPRPSDESDGADEAASLETAAGSDDAVVTEEEVAPESYRRSQWDPEDLLAELAELRRDALRKVKRRPLYVMAEGRGVPLLRRAFMTNGQLFDAILIAEGVSPGDASTSPQKLERVRELTAEMIEYDGD
jgi:hypothetical protein